jgi:DNA-binding response OmpR family regulator
VRPFTSRKLLHSLNLLLRESSPHILQCGGVRLDLVSRTVVGPNGQKHLTPKQCDLLADLLRRPNQVISRKDLMEHVWDTRYLGDTRTLDVHIRWLREKIEPDARHPRYLITRRGVGYMFAAPDAGQPLDDPLEDDL